MNVKEMVKKNLELTADNADNPMYDVIRTENGFYLRCIKCFEIKPLTEENFYRTTVQDKYVELDNFVPTCRQCRREYNKRYYQKNRKKLLERSRRNAKALHAQNRKAVQAFKRGESARLSTIDHHDVIIRATDILRDQEGSFERAGEFLGKSAQWMDSIRRMKSKSILAEDLDLLLSRAEIHGYDIDIGQDGWSPRHGLRACKSCFSSQFTHAAHGYCKRCEPLWRSRGRPDNFHWDEETRRLAGFWSEVYRLNKCHSCNSDKKQHVAHGLCRSCYGTWKKTKPCNPWEFKQAQYHPVLFAKRKARGEI